MRLAIMLSLTISCASTPQVIQLLPDKEPICGFTRVADDKFIHCCVASEGPVLIVKCLELERTDPPKPPPDNPARAS